MKKETIYLQALDLAIEFSKAPDGSKVAFMTTADQDIRIGGVQSVHFTTNLQRLAEPDTGCTSATGMHEPAIGDGGMICLHCYKPIFSL